MIVYRKVTLPSESEVTREMRNFAGSFPQRVLHNKLVAKLESAREILEKTASWDEALRQQGEIRAILSMLDSLHETTTTALKEQLYV